MRPILRCALLGLTGCAQAIYGPTEPRPAMGPGVLIDVVSVRGAAAKAEVLLRTQQPTLIGPVSWSPSDHDHCGSELSLSVGRDVRVAEGEHAPPSFEINGEQTVFVDLQSGPKLTGQNLFLDFKVDTGSLQGCLRLPLTAADDRTLWRAQSAPWSVSFGLRFDHPLAPLAGTGARGTLEVRAIRPLGPVRGFFGFTGGFASCRGAECPPDDNNDEQATGVFGHVGGELGVDRRFALNRRWTLAAALAGNVSWFRVSAPADWPGDKTAGVAGPFASLTLLGFGGDGPIAGFAPEARGAESGPELFVHRLTAFGRGPTETAWVIGFGWRVEGTH